MKFVVKIFLIFFIMFLLTGCTLLTNNIYEDEAINLVLERHPEFPHNVDDIKEIKVRTGGPAPGIIVGAELITEIEKTKDNKYIVLLTKNWNVSFNGVNVQSYWKYQVDHNSVVLLDSNNNDYKIDLIK